MFSKCICIFLQYNQRWYPFATLKPGYIWRFYPVISAISCCVIFWRCRSSTNCRIVSEDLLNTFSWIFSIYTSSLFSWIPFLSGILSCSPAFAYPSIPSLISYLRDFITRDKFLEDILCFFYRSFSSVLSSLSVFHGVWPQCASGPQCASAK